METVVHFSESVYLDSNNSYVKKIALPSVQHLQSFLKFKFIFERSQKMNLIKNIINYNKNVKYYYKVNTQKSISLMWVAGTSHNLSKLSQTLFPCFLFKKKMLFFWFI